MAGHADNNESGLKKHPDLTGRLKRRDLKAIAGRQEMAEQPAADARAEKPSRERDAEGRLLKRTNLRFPVAYADVLRLLTVKRKKREHVYELLALAVGDFIQKQVAAGIITEQELRDIEASVEG